MFKTLIVVSLAVVCCRSQLDIPNRLDRLSNLALPAPFLAVKGPAVAVAPAPIAVAAPAPLPIPIQQFRTQEVLPVQDLGVVNGGPQVVQVRGAQEPVLVHFQSESAPVRVETSHIPSPPGETTVTQSQDEPHTVIHEIIRPVIQEVREIIQPYRRVTQEIRPVQEEVHTDVAANAGGVAVAAPVATAAVAAPVATAVAAPFATAAYAAPFATTSYAAPASWALNSLNLRSGSFAPLTVAVPAQPLPNAGVIASPAPLYTGSYIQQFIDQYGLRQLNTPLIAARPQLQITAPKAVAVVDAAEPIVSEAAEIVPQVTATKRVGLGSFLYTRKYAEY